MQRLHSFFYLENSELESWPRKEALTSVLLVISPHVPNKRMWLHSVPSHAFKNAVRFSQQRKVSNDISYYRHITPGLFFMLNETRKLCSNLVQWLVILRIQNSEVDTRVISSILKFYSVLTVIAYITVRYSGIIPFLEIQSSSVEGAKSYWCLPNFLPQDGDTWSFQNFVVRFCTFTDCAKNKGLNYEWFRMLL